MIDLKELGKELASLSERVVEARSFLHIGKAEYDAKRLEEELAKPGIWDDPQHAQEVSKKLADVK